MRMWGVSPNMLCREHLLGEHLEMHMFAGSIKKGISMKGYVDNNLLEPRKIKERHDALAEEMLIRGYKHRSPLVLPDQYVEDLPEYIREYKLRKDDAFIELVNRCDNCASRLRMKGRTHNAVNG